MTDTNSRKSGEAWDHSHSIINRPSKPAWLKELAVIDMSLYRRFYRQNRTSFADAGDGTISRGNDTNDTIINQHQGYQFEVPDGKLNHCLL